MLHERVTSTQSILTDDHFKVISSEHTGGMITSAALSALSKFLSLSFIHGASARTIEAMAAISQAVTGCKFEAMDEATDEVPMLGCYMETSEMLCSGSYSEDLVDDSYMHPLLCWCPSPSYFAPAISKCILKRWWLTSMISGAMLRETDILAMLRTVLHIAQDERSSLTLRSVAETTLVDVTRILFDRSGEMIQQQHREVCVRGYDAQVLCAVLDFFCSVIRTTPDPVEDAALQKVTDSSLFLLG